MATAIPEMELQKSFSYVLSFEKELDTAQRIIRGYASTETLDREGQIVAKDAIAQALDEYLHVNPTVRADHHPPPIGTTIKAQITNKGLFIHAQLFKGTHAAEDAWQTILQGGYRAFSIGGLVRKASRVFDKELNAHVTKITELTLSEISITDAPANTQCLFEVLSKSIAPELEKRIGPWKDFDACVEHFVSDPDFQPQGGRSKREAAQAACAEIERKGKAEKDMEATRMSDATTKIEKQDGGEPTAQQPTIEERVAALEQRLAALEEKLAGGGGVAASTDAGKDPVTTTLTPDFMKQFADELRKELGITVTPAPVRTARQETDPALQGQPPSPGKEEPLTISKMILLQKGFRDEKEEAKS